MSAAGKNRVDVVRCLLDNGAKIDTKNKGGLTALHRASQDAHIDVVKLLLDRGANVHALANDGRTVLHSVANNNHADIAALLISRGAIISAADLNGWTPLHCAACKYKNKQNKTKKTKNKNKNKKDLLSFYCAFVLSIDHGHILVATVLLKNGANVNSRTNAGNTTLWIAKENGRARMVELLKANGAK